jgi:hypothetical protein
MLFYPLTMIKLLSGGYEKEREDLKDKKLWRSSASLPGGGRPP